MKRQKHLIKNLKNALQQDYLYNYSELAYMREQLQIHEEMNVVKKKEKVRGHFTPLSSLPHKYFY